MKKLLVGLLATRIEFEIDNFSANLNLILTLHFSRLTAHFGTFSGSFYQSKIPESLIFV